MQYINPKTNTVYSGDRAHWTHIPVTSEQPSPYHVPVVEGGEHTGWEPTPDARDSLKAEAAEERDRRMGEGIVFEGVKYTMDARSRTDVDAAARDAERRDKTRRWKGWDPETGKVKRVEFDAEKLDQLHAAMADRVQDLFDAEEALEKTIDEASGDDLAEIDVTDDGHWP